MSSKVGRCRGRWREWGTDRGKADVYELWEGLQETTHPMPIEDIGQLISSQLHVRPQLRPRPAHSHLACGDCLKLEVPATTLHRIGFLCPEDAHSIPTGLAFYQTYKWGQAESKRLDGEWIQGNERMVRETSKGQAGRRGTIVWC